MDKLGQYITQEYGLLKQILQYLPAKDLINARNVCRTWAEVINVILAEENKPIWGYSFDSKAVKWSQKSVLQTIPRVVFYYTSGVSKKVSDCKALEVCPCKYGSISTELILIEDKLLKRKRKLLFGSGCYDFMPNFSCIMILPSLPGIEVTSSIIYKNDCILDEVVTHETLCQLIGEEPIKCLLIYTYKNTSRECRWTDSFLRQVLDRQGNNNIAIGGGDARKLRLFEGKEKCKQEQIAVYIVTLKGDNVTAHSQLLSSTNKTEIGQFMKQMANDVGPIPSRSERFAFVVECINRCYLWAHTTEDMIYEGKKFKEAFPGVPQYGFLGFGEYGIDTIASDSIAKKRKKSIDVLHTNTTSFVILTLHNVHK